MLQAAFTLGFDIPQHFGNFFCPLLDVKRMNRSLRSSCVFRLAHMVLVIRHGCQLMQVGDSDNLAVAPDISKFLGDDHGSRS